MKNLMFVFLTFITCAAMLAESPIETASSNIAEDITKSLNNTQIQTIAVIDFSYFEPKTSALDNFLTNTLVVDIMTRAKGRYQVIERHLVNKVLHEKKVQSQAMFQNSVNTIGKLLGADLILTGTITDNGEDFVVLARLIRVSNSAIYSVAKARIPKTKTVTQLYQTILAERNHPLVPTKKNVENAKKIGSILLDMGEISFSASGLRMEFFLTSDVEQITGIEKLVYYDDKGNTVTSPYITMANRTNYSYLENQQIILGIKTSCSFLFKNARYKPQTIPLLKFSLLVDGQWQKVELRNLQVP